MSLSHNLSQDPDAYNRTVEKRRAQLDVVESMDGYDPDFYDEFFMTDWDEAEYEDED